MKLKLMCVKYNVKQSTISKIANVSRATVVKRMNDTKGTYWNEPQMMAILEYFQSLNSSITLTDLFF